MSAPSLASAAPLAACLALSLLPACEPAAVAPAGPSDPPPPFEVGIERVQVTQGVQNRGGTVSLVQGRSALLRVFLRARRTGIPSPGVRVSVVETSTGTALRTYVAAGSADDVPTYVADASLAGTWNVILPGADVQPGRHLVATMDPVAGAQPSDTVATLRLPAAGSLDVRPVPRLPVTLVPIGQSGLVPDVNGSRSAESWLARALGVHPLVDIDVQVAQPYTTTASLESNGSGWPVVLSELERKRLVEGASRHYVGAVRVSYPAGTAGRGYVGGRSLLAWDRADTYQRVVAHELGHNFGLGHAPCGNVDATSLDPYWPSDSAYAGARIGVFGWDPAAGLLKHPASTWDHMSYCGDEATTWTSDYNYLNALVGVSAQALAAPAETGAVQPCLLVSGRMAGGQVELDPTYLVETVPSLLPEGDYAVELLGPGGEPSLEVRFAPREVPSEELAPGGEQHFAMALPLSGAAGADLAGRSPMPGQIRPTDFSRLVVRHREREVARLVAPVRGVAAAGPQASRLGAGRVRLRWETAAGSEALVRDPDTGRVLAFVRNGAADLEHAGELEVQLSDGLRSQRWRVRPR